MFHYHLIDIRQESFTKGAEMRIVGSFYTLLCHFGKSWNVYLEKPKIIIAMKKLPIYTLPTLMNALRFSSVVSLKNSSNNCDNSCIGCVTNSNNRCEKWKLQVLVETFYASF